MTQLEKLEAKLDKLLDKKAPFKLPADSRKSLAGAMWWLAGIAGVLQAYVAWTLDKWQEVNEFVEAANNFARSFGVDTGASELGFSFYLSLAVLGVSAALLLLAVPGLKAFKKAGWNLVFYGLLVNLVYGVIFAFTSYGGFGDLVGAALGSLIGAYLLFQVRSQFSGKGAHAAAPKAS
jgi:hypothetical protein